jgi:dihydrofolate reductase
MSKVIYALSVSLDGFVEGPGGDLSWSYANAELRRHIIERECATRTCLYGRRLYETMAAYWSTADQNPAASDFDLEYAQIWKAKKKVVFSRTLAEVNWNAELFKGDIAIEINRLKAQPDNDMLVGGANLAGTFMRLGFIDEYRLYINPIVLGGGKPMFPPLREKIKLNLIETRLFGAVVLLRYANETAV